MLCFPTQGPGNIIEEEAERTEKVEDKQKCSKMLSSGHDMAMPLMNSQ